MRSFRSAPLAAAVLLSTAIAQANIVTTLFSDNFNTAASAANYTTVTTDATSSFATWAYDYSAFGIPSSPNSGGSTIGVKLDANRFAPSNLEAITLHTLSTFTGDYTLTFDAWMNVNGTFPNGGGGSTRYLTAGVGGDGVTNNFPSSSGKGGWSAVNGANDNGFDYRWYKDAALQGAATNQYAASAVASDPRDGDNPYYASLGQIDVSNLPVQGANNGGPAQQTGLSWPGSFGMDWHEVMLIRDADGGTGGTASLRWYIDNLLIGTLDAGNGAPFASTGAITVGYADSNLGLSDLPTHSFALIDNLIVTDQVPEPTSLALLLPALALVARRRRITGRRIKGHA